MDKLIQYLVSSPISSTIAGIIGLLFVANVVFGEKKDPREPPYITPSIPIFGHMWGLWFVGSRYLVKFAKKYKYPIYTLKVPGGKVYIACQPETITAIEKNPKAVAFSPLAANVISRLSAVSSETKAAMFENIIAEDGDYGYFPEITKEVHATLRPGANLDIMSASVADTTTNYVSGLWGKKTTFHLHDWVQHVFSMGSTNAVYGPMNPFKDPAVESGFWDFDGGVSTLLLSFWPALTCPKGHGGRVRAWNGFEKYYLAGGHEQGSALTKARFKIARQKGISVRDIARLEVTMIIGILTNTVPSGFWMIYFMYSQPTLLAELRQELDAIVEPASQYDEESAKTYTHVLNLNRIKDECPLFNGTWQETLRSTTCGISSRIVTRDIILNDQFLLKKDAVVELPNNATHSNPDLWGPKVDAFNPRRFLKPSAADPPLTAAQKAAGDKHKIPRATFRPFGGGTSLCAGRHQAANQLLGAMALFCAGFDVVPTNGTGQWQWPGAHGHTIAAAVDSPNHDIPVEVSPRKGMEERKWLLTTAAVPTGSGAQTG